MDSTAHCSPLLSPSTFAPGYRLSTVPGLAQNSSLTTSAVYDSDCDHGEKTQGEEDVRQGGGGEPHRQARRDGLQRRAEEEGKLDKRLTRPSSRK